MWKRVADDLERVFSFQFLYLSIIPYLMPVRKPQNTLPGSKSQESPFVAMTWVDD